MALTNNDIIKKLRVALELRDDDIIEILKLVDYKISKSELGAFFRKEDHDKYMLMGDQILRNFLNGLVIYKRGPMERKPQQKGSSGKKLPNKKPHIPKREDKPKSKPDGERRDIRFGK